MAIAPYDISLFTRARSGDADAFTTLTGTCEAAVFRIALRITGNMADAEDVRQQTLLKAFAHFDQFAMATDLRRGSHKLPRMNQLVCCADGATAVGQVWMK